MTKHRAGWIILAVSGAIAAYFAVYGGFQYSADGTTFFRQADELFRLHPIGNYLFSSGYSILILLTLYPLTGSVVPLVAIQAGMAALIPWLATRMFDGRTGIAAGIVSLVSLSPFFFQGHIFHDHSGLFFSLLAMTLAAVYFRTSRPAYVYASVASATFSYFIQPAMIGVMAALLAVLALFTFRRKRGLLHVGCSAALFVAVVVGSSLAQQAGLRHMGWSNAEAEQLGRRLFYTTYMQGSAQASFAGDSARRLQADFARFLDRPSDDLISHLKSRYGDPVLYQDMVGQYLNGRGADLAERIFAQPNRQYFETVLILPDRPGGPRDRLYLWASAAFMFHHPIVTAGYLWDNFVGFTVGPSWRCVGTSPYPKCIREEYPFFYPLYQEVSLQPDALPARSYSLLTSRVKPTGPFVNALISYWQAVYSVARPFLLVAMMMGWLLALRSPAHAGLRWPLGLCLLTYFANAILFSVFQTPEYRYVIPGLAISAFAAGAGACVWIGAIASALQRLRSTTRLIDRTAA